MITIFMVAISLMNKLMLMLIIRFWQKLYDDCMIKTNSSTFFMHITGFVLRKKIAA